jgi:hypothetical protein
MKKKYVLIIGLSLSMLSCEKKSESIDDRGSVSADSISVNGYVSSSAAVETGKDTARKFIRTADMKFRVKNVAKVTYQIEDLTNQTNGFVAYTNLVSNIDDQNTTPISADSILETIHYTVSNTMKLRVPNTKLDSTLKAIANFIDYLDYRIIQANDVGIEILSNQFVRKRVGKHEERLKTAINSRGKKLNETTTAEETLFNKQELSDNALISNLSLQDQINFSTIQLLIYQRQEVKRWVILNDKNIDAYEPNFGSRLFESLKYGWNILEDFIILISKLWGLLLFALVIYVSYKKFGHKLKMK